MADEAVVVLDDIYPLLKLNMAARNAEKQIPPEPHWVFCYTMLHKDDSSIETDVKVPILIAFHRHIYHHDWHFSWVCSQLSKGIFTSAGSWLI
ncbi:Squalene synthase [Glycine soja]|uniref:Squalene synthase n=1 Tax=Glycine soja TaxID=3848 RepID=A0A0B2QSA4_GLYSO|nr:Squalene synthase [Glycine soja]